MRRLIGVIRRVGWGVGDQAFSSLTNFALGVFVAREVSSDAFGAFSLAFATYVMVMNVSRAIATEPLVVRYSASHHGVVRRGASSATGTAFVMGVIASVGCLGVAWQTHGPLSQAFLALALTFPGLLVQDAWRFSFFAWGRGGQAFLSDAIWALVMFPGIRVLDHFHIESVFTLTLVWGGAATVAAIVGLFQSSVVPRARRTLAWLREHRDLSPNFLAELMALSGARQVVLYGVGAVAGLAATGALRGAQMLLNPLNVLSQGIRLMVIPDAVRMLKTDVPERAARAVRRNGIWLSVTLASLALGVSLFAYLLPLHIGVQILGETWARARSLVIPIGLASAGGGVVVGASVGLRALAAAKRSRQARTVLSIGQVAGGIIGALIAGPAGAAWGLGSSTVLGSVVWWWHLQRELAIHAARTSATELFGDDVVAAVVD